MAPATEALAVPPREAELLALATACELDPTLSRVLGYLDDTTAPAPPTPANAALLWGWPPGYQPGPASALARWRLAGPTGPWQRTTAWTVDGGIAAFLAGDARWAGFDAAVAAPDVQLLGCLHPELLADMLAQLTRLGARDCEVELVGPAGSGGRTLLAQLALAAGREPVLLQGDDRIRAVRAARLLGAVPVLTDDNATEGGAGPSPTWAQTSRSWPGPGPPRRRRRASADCPGRCRRRPGSSGSGSGPRARAKRHRRRWPTGTCPPRMWRPLSRSPRPGRGGRRGDPAAAADRDRPVDDRAGAALLLG